MFQPLVYVDTSTVRDGALDELRVAIGELAEFVEANEPDLLSYAAYISDDGTRMTVMHVHSSPASLEHHMKVAGPRFERFTELLTLRSIRVFGEPSPETRRRLLAKARLLGCSDVSVDPLQAGFGRFQGE